MWGLAVAVALARVLMPAEPAPLESIASSGGAPSTTLPPGVFPGAPLGLGVDRPPLRTPARAPAVSCRAINDGLPAALRDREPLPASLGARIFTPDPDPRELRQTRWARDDRRPGCNRTRLCVGADGRVDRVTTQIAFRGDPEVDAIITRTVQGWRFGPGTGPMRTPGRCTTVTFIIMWDR